MNRLLGPDIKPWSFFRCQPGLCMSKQSSEDAPAEYGVTDLDTLAVALVVSIANSFHQMEFLVTCPASLK